MTRNVTIEEIFDRSVTEIDKTFDRVFSQSVITDKTHVEIENFINYSQQKTKRVDEYERTLRMCDEELKNKYKDFQDTYVSLLNKINEEEFDLHLRYLNLVEYETLHASEENVLSFKIKQLTDQISQYEEIYNQMSIQSRQLSVILKSDYFHKFKEESKELAQNIQESKEKITQMFTNILSLQNEKTDLISKTVHQTNQKIKSLESQKARLSIEKLPIKEYNFDSSLLITQKNHLIINQKFKEMDLIQFEEDLVNTMEQINKKYELQSNIIKEISLLQKQSDALKNKSKYYRNIDLPHLLIRYFSLKCNKPKPMKFDFDEKEEELRRLQESINTENSKSIDLENQKKALKIEIRNYFEQKEQLTSELNAIQRNIKIQEDIAKELNKKRLQIFNQKYASPIRVSPALPIISGENYELDSKIAEIDELYRQIYNLSIKIDSVRNQLMKQIFMPVYNDSKLMNLRSTVKELENKCIEKKQFIEARKLASFKARESLQRILNECVILRINDDSRIVNSLHEEVQKWVSTEKKDEMSNLMNWICKLNLYL